MRLSATLVVVVIVVLILPFLTTLVGAESTAPIVWSNKKEYDPSEIGYLYGYGFKPFAEVNITIIRPDLVEDRVQTSTDEFGYFSSQYQLDGIHGTFKATATDGLNVASTTFDNCLYLNAWWKSQDSTYIYAEAGGLATSKQYYIKYFDPLGVEKRQSPSYTGTNYFKDNLTILPTFPNIFGWWTVKLFENGYIKRTKQVYIDKIVWTTDSTYTVLVTSFARGQTVYFKTMGLKTDKYYRFKLEKPDGAKFYVGSWTTGVTSMTGSYSLPSDAPLGTWILHVRQAYDASGSCEDHYVDCRFAVTTAPPPIQYYLTVRTDPLGIGTIPGSGWYNACTFVNLTAPEHFPGITGTRYRFNYWDVDGVGKGEGVREISIHMNTTHTATAHYITQYFLNLTTNPPGVTTPSAVGWYDAGTSAPIFSPEFISIEVGASRYKFNGWSTGDMSEIANCSATSTTVFMDKAKIVTANYVTQYFVTFNQTGLDSSASDAVVTVNGSAKTFNQLLYSLWVDKNTVITYSYTTVVSSSVSGKKFLLINVIGPTSPINVTSKVTVSGNYKTQYYLTVISPYGSPDGMGWYNSSDIAYATLDTNVVDHGNGTRRLFTNWSGDASGTNYMKSDPIIIDGPKTAVANWKTQYSVSFTQTGSAVVPTVTYTADTDPTQTVPFNAWVKAGSQITYTYQDIVLGAPGVRYVLTSVSPSSSQTVNSPLTVSGTYKIQYYLTVNTDPSGIVSILGEGWYNSSKSVSLTAPLVTGYTFLNWDVDGVSQGSGVSSIAVNMNAPHTAITHYAIAAPPLSVSVSPPSASITADQSTTFTSTVGGGTTPYNYQWYLNGNLVSGATSSNWTFSPTSPGTFSVHVKVTDKNGNTAQSAPATVNVSSAGGIPVGGYSISLVKRTPVSAMTMYAMLMVMFGAALSLTKRKRK